MSNEKKIDAFPLSWPDGWKRTRFRERSRFEVSFARARDSLFEEVRRLGASAVILSTNIALRLDGIPYANRNAPQDPGVAIYFKYKNKPMVFACDKWRTVDENTWAICKTIEAIRGIERWGASDMLERAFTGFQALAAPMVTSSWWSILGISRDSSIEEISSARNALAFSNHPDRGGSHGKMASINYAYDQAIEEKKT